MLPHTSRRVQVVIELGSLSYMYLRLVFLLAGLFCMRQRDDGQWRAKTVLRASRTMVYISGVSTLMFSPSPMLLQTIWNYMNDFYLVHCPRALLKDDLPLRGKPSGEVAAGTRRFQLEESIQVLHGLPLESSTHPLTGRSLLHRALYFIGRVSLLLLFGIVVGCSCFFLICKLTSLSFAIKHNVFSQLRLLPLVTYIGALNQLVIPPWPSNSGISDIVRLM